MKEQTELEILTQERKKMDKKIKRLKRKLTVFNFFSDENRIVSLHQNTSLGVFCGLITTAILLIPFGIFLKYLTTATMFWGTLGLVVTPLVSSILACYFMGLATEKIEKKIAKLKVDRDELVKHIDCIRSNVKYVAPIPEPKQAETKNSFFEMCRQFEIERRQNLLEKARLRHIDVDRILQGPQAYENKKEYKSAKEDLKNFLEENNSSYT